MTAEMEEYLVGAYLKVVEGCQFVDYNVRPPGGGLKGLDELDVIGFDFEKGIAFLCEVTTHIGGLLYVDNPTTVQRIATKHEKQRRYAHEHLGHLSQHKFLFWSPVVPRGYVTEHLARIEGLELVINEEYGRRIAMLRQKAGQLKNDMGNPAFRLLQILEHVRSPKE